MNEDHRKIFELGSAKINEWKKLNPESSLDLEGIIVKRFIHENYYGNTNFSKVNLSNSQLISYPPRDHIERLHFNNSDFQNSNLENTIISSANMKNVNFSEANLRSASITATNLANVNFSEAKFHNTNLSSCYLKNSNLSLDQIRNSILENIDFTWFNFIGKTIRKGKFSGSKMKGLSFSLSIFQDCDLSKVDMSFLKNGYTVEYMNMKERFMAKRKKLNIDSLKVSKGGASFINSNLEDVNAFNSYLRGSFISDSNLSRSNLSYADLSYAKFENCNLRNVNFSNTNLNNCIFINCDFEEATFENTILLSTIFTSPKNLDKINHKNTSVVNKDTIWQNHFPFVFYKGLGIPTWEVELILLRKTYFDEKDLQKINRDILKLIEQYKKNNFTLNSNDELQDLRRTISNGELEKAMIVLLKNEEIVENKFEDSLLLIKSRFNRLKMDYDFSFVTREEREVELNLITNSLLGLIRKIENEA